MIGCKSKAAFEFYQGNKALLPTVEKYGKKYHMDKLLMMLAQRKFIMYLSRPKTKFMYVSHYMEPEDLSEYIRQTKASKDLKQRILIAASTI
jgi:hypothetical protein